jgi:hypothetical protein
MQHNLDATPEAGNRWGSPAKATVPMAVQRTRVLNCIRHIHTYVGSQAKSSLGHFERCRTNAADQSLVLLVFLAAL